MLNSSVIIFAPYRLQVREVGGAGFGPQKRAEEHGSGEHTVSVRVPSMFACRAPSTLTSLAKMRLLSHPQRLYIHNIIVLY
jgi:hypothetical protein